MGREVKRVPLDFDWPMDVVWYGHLGVWPQRNADKLSEKWETIIDDHCQKIKLDVPEGEGWQMWENTTEGSPLSPVFKTPEELAHWLADNDASAMGSETASYESWLATINQGWAPSMVMTGDKIMSGVEATNREEPK